MLRPVLALALALLLAAPAAAEPLADIVAGRTAATPGLAGLVVVVADRQGVVRAQAFGAAIIDPARALVPDTPLRVASVSKAVVAIGVMRLSRCAGKLAAIAVAYFGDQRWGGL